VAPSRGIRLPPGIALTYSHTSRAKVPPCATPDEPSKNLYPVLAVVSGVARVIAGNSTSLIMAVAPRTTAASTPRPNRKPHSRRLRNRSAWRNFSQPTRSGIAFSDQRMTEERAVSGQGGVGIHACVTSLLKKGALAPAVPKAKGAPSRQFRIEMPLRKDPYHGNVK
jgi:hypothetical protein